VLGRVLKELRGETKVHSIDPHEGRLTVPGDSLETEEPTYRRFLENIRRAGLECVVEPIRQRSLDVKWDQPVNLLLVDALHDYENVSADFHHFDRWVAPGSYVAFHDYGDTYPGVKQFVDEIVQSGSYQTVAKVDILILLKKVGAGEARHGTSPQGNSMTHSDGEAPLDRLERQSKGISILQEVVRDEMAARAEQLSERDKIIQGLQRELHTKVGECNEVINDLHARLNEGMKARDKAVLETQAKLRLQQIEHTQTVARLREQMQSQSARSESVIADLWAQLGEIRHSKTWRLLGFFMRLDQKLRGGRSAETADRG
jgi:hypothetical protein